MLGINNYGNRAIALVRDDKKERSKTFCSLFALQIITTFIVLIAYLVYIIFINNSYLSITKILTIYLFTKCFI